MGLLLITLIMGGIVGWLASVLMHTDQQMGIFANIAVGVLGSFIGHFIAGLLGFAAYGLIARLIVATAGAALLIAGLRHFGVYR